MQFVSLQIAKHLLFILIGSMHEIILLGEESRMLLNALITILIFKSTWETIKQRNVYKKLTFYRN